MYRVKDPKATRHFYEDILGMRLVNRIDMEAGKFSLYFFAYVPKDVVTPSVDDPSLAQERSRWVFSHPGHFIECTHNWGTETDPNFAGYHTGNSEPRGFGHIAIVVPDVDQCVDRLEKAGVTFKKKPQEGSMKGIAFALDPDGYWVEIIKDAAVV